MITLNANKFLGTITNLVGTQQTADTMQGGELGEFVNSFQDINVENGDGKVIYSSDIYDVLDLNANVSSLLTSNPPDVKEQYINVTRYKVIPLTINRYLTRNAFVQENQLAYFVAHLIAVMESTKLIHMANDIIAEIEAYEPTNDAQTVELALETIEDTDSAETIEAKNRLNAKKIFKALINKSHDVSWDSNEYNDDKFTEIINNNEMKVIIKTEDNTDMVVDALATLLNSAKITDAEKWGRTFAVPSRKFNNSEDVVAWFMHNKKIQFGYFYNVATSFFDGSTLNEQDWLHFSYYLDTVNAYPCIKLVRSSTV